MDIRETADAVARAVLPMVEETSLPIVRPFPGQLTSKIKMGVFFNWKKLDPANRFDSPDVCRALSERFVGMASELRAGEHPFRTDRSRGAQLYEIMATEFSPRQQPN